MFQTTRKKFQRKGWEHKDEGGRSSAALSLYALPSFAMAMMVVPVTAVLPSIYAKHASISLSTIGAILIVTRIFDAFSDQIIGYLSDRTTGKLGARKPWIIGGMLLAMLSVLYLFNPPVTAGAIYFGMWSLVFYTGYTMINIPHLAWGAEMSSDYHQRSRIFTYRSALAQCGGLLFFAGPIILFQLGYIDAPQMEPEAVKAISYVIFGALPIMVGLALFLVPKAEVVSTGRSSLRVLFTSIWGNKPFLRYLSAFMISGAGIGAFGSLMLIYFDSFLGIPEKFPIALIFMALLSLLSLPFWLKIVAKYGKHKPWAFSWLTNGLVLLCFFFVSPGADAFYPVIVILGIYAVLGAVSDVVPSAILADIIDYDILKTGCDHAGNYYALHGLTAKFSAALGGGLGFFVLDGFGYIVAEGASNSEFAKTGMIVAVAIIPALLKLSSLALIWSFPIDRRRQLIIRRRIEQRVARSQNAMGTEPVEKSELSL